MNACPAWLHVVLGKIVKVAKEGGGRGRGCRGYGGRCNRIFALNIHERVREVEEGEINAWPR